MTCFGTRWRLLLFCARGLVILLASPLPLAANARFVDPRAGYFALQEFGKKACNLWEKPLAGLCTSATASSDVKARYLRPLALKCHRVQRLRDSWNGRKDEGRRVTLFTLKMNFTASHISCPTKILWMVRVTSVARWPAEPRPNPWKDARGPRVRCRNNLV